MILMRHCILFVVLAVTSAVTDEEQSRSAGLLQKIIDHIKPYVFDSVVITANNSFENVRNNGRNASVVHKYYLTEESDDEDEDRKFFNFFKKKKKKKPSNSPEKPVKPEDSEQSVETDEKPFKPGSKPLQPEHKPLVNESKPIYEDIPVYEDIPSAHGTTSPPHELDINGINNKIKVVKNPSPKLPSFIPKRKVILMTTTVVVHTTSVQTIFPSCLKMHNVHSVCENNLMTITPSNTLFPSGNIWRSELPNLKKPTIEDENPEIRKLVDNTTPLIKPTTTIPVQITKVATLNGTESSSLDTVSGTIGETESISDQMNSAQTTTPDLISNDRETKFSETRILPYLLKPKIEYSTKFLHVTETKDFYDFSQTATVIAVNCVPVEAKKLPLCPLEKPSLVVNSAEAYHSNFIQMIKAQNQMASNLTGADLNYLSTKILPPYYEITEPKDVAMNERVLSDALQRIQQMIFQYVIDSWEHRNK